MKQTFKFLILFLLTLLGTSNLWAANRTVFLDVSTNWKNDNAKFGINAWGNGIAADTKMMTKINDNLYYAIVDDNQTKVQFIRFNNTHSSTTFEWKGEWNRIEVDISKSNNYMKVSDWTSGEWKNNTISIKGTPDSWKSNLLTLTDNANGTYTGTISNFVAQNTSETYKPTDSQGNWYGSDQNVKMVASATYDISFTLTLSSNSVQVTATQKTFFVTASSANTNMGTVSPASAWVGSSAVTFTATPKTGYHWTSWSKTDGANPSNAATSSVTATADGTITANFAANEYAVTLNTNGGTINSCDVTSYIYGVGATLPTDVTKTGYDFGGWFDNSGLTGSAVTTISTTATGDKEYWAKWTPKEYAVNFSGSNFTPSFESGTNKAYGSTVEFTLTPATDYAIDGVTAKDASDNNVPVTNNAGTYSFTMPNSAVTVSVATHSTAAKTYLIRFLNYDGTVLQEGQVEENTTPSYSGATPTKPSDTEWDYTFDEWTPAITAVTKAQDYTATYSSTRRKYTLTWEYAGGSVVTEGTPAGQVANEDPITAPILERDGYEFTSWTPEVPATMPAANSTYTAQWSEITHTVTIENGTESSTIAGVATEGTATVRALAADEKFTGWTIPAGVTLTQGTTTNSTTIHFHANADNLTVTANIGKKTLVKLYFANNNGWSKVYAHVWGGDHETTWPGHNITANTEVINCVTYYYYQYYAEDETHNNIKFNEGQQTGGAQTEDLTIADRASDYADMTHWKSAPYDALWGFYIQGNETPSKIEAQDYPATDCENGTATINLPANAQIKFKAHNNVTGKWYGCNNNDPISGTIADWEFFDQYDNKATNDSKMRTNEAGTYTFKVVATDDANKVKVSVTYPAAETFAVTISADDNGSVEPNGEQQVDAFTGISVTAKPNPGYRFKEWVTSDGITVTNSTNATTTVKASKAGTLQATFTTEGMIYFNKAGISSKWTGDVYVYFYKGEYWDKDHTPSNGSGSKTSANCTSGPHKMNRLGNSQIYYFDYAGAGITKQSNVISFTDQYLSEADNFFKCSASYRTDFHTCANMFVPRDYIDYYNQCAYYSKGYWRTFQSTDPGYDITIWNNHDGTGDQKAHGDFVGTSNLSNDFTFTANLDGNHTYGFKISSCGGTWYGNQGTMTQDCNWEFDSEGTYTNNCGLTTTATGEYKFTLNCTDGWLRVSVEYPLSEGDYRLAYEELRGSDIEKIHPTHHIKALRADGTKVDTVSFFVQQKTDAYIYLQKCTAISGTNITWENVSSTSGNKVDLSTFTDEAGVYNFTLTQTKSNETLTPEVALLEAYKGPYYIRTDCAGGGWSAYDIADNEMTQSNILAQNANGFDHYFVKWVAANTNVKYCVANNYSEALTDSLKGDTYIGEDKQVLPQDANVRFMWNSKTNALERAYLSGSTNTEDRYLVLEGDAKMFFANGDVIGEGSETDHRKGLHANELNFTDKNNWVYQADIKAQPGCAVKLTANYNNNIQYFIGKESGEGATKTIIKSSTEGSTTQYTMRVVYDYKTNLLVAGWVPSNTPITENISLGGDMLISRTHQDDAQQITFGVNPEKPGSIEDIHHIYGVLSIKKDTMLGKGIDEKAYTTIATNADYSRTMYWISFPFDVKISEIFGVDGYGQKWIMQKYRGDLRAQKGWFKGDGTETFWEFMDESETLKAYEGYLFLIDANYFNTEGADVWKNSATEANFYFPSASGNIGIINKSEYTQEVPAHKCDIKREFNIGTEQHPIMVSHEQTDSYWNVIGVPAFQNKSMALSETEVDTKMKAIYEWNSSENTYIVKALHENFEFKTMYAYMVQFGGDITWSDVSVVNNPTEAQGGPAPKYAYADEKNYMIELFFNGNGAEDHTYINLADEASTDFVLNEDMMKIDNAGFPNIYSFAGNYNVAYNETKMDNQTVMLGVSAPKDGNYTFSMPKDFSGTAKLVDLVEGITTDLNVANYSVDLNKGTYNNRFQLVLEVEAKTPTSIEADGQRGREADGKTTKLLRNGEIYLINGGRVYNVLGVEE